MVDWFKHSKKRSTSWKNGKNSVTKLSRTELNIPEGLHDVEVRLVASETKACLIRIKKILSDEEEE